MDRFLVRPREEGEGAGAPVVLAPEVQHIVDVGMQRPKKKRRRGNTPWSNWTEEQKKACCEQFTKHGYMYLRNEYSDSTPPPSTVRTWVQILALKGKLRLAGRPRWLTEAEESRLFNSVVALRRHGCIVDRETLIIMAHAAVKLSRGDDTNLPPLTVHWCKAYMFVSESLITSIHLIFQEEVQNWPPAQGNEHSSTPDRYASSLSSHHTLLTVQEKRLTLSMTGGVNFVRFELPLLIGAWVSQLAGVWVSLMTL